MQYQYIVGTSQYNIMEITINEHTKLLEIRNAFRKNFTHLDLAFFIPKNDHQLGFKKSDQLELDTTYSEATDEHKIGTLIFDGNKTVEAFEHALFEQFGLSAQVLRKSGNAWLQTTTSDIATLQQLNLNAIESANTTIEKEELPDIHEQE